MNNFTLTTDADGIALLSWDMPGKSMNVVDQSVMDELEELIARVQADAAIKGAVVTSGKPTFSGGADLGMLAGLGSVTLASPDAEKQRARAASARLGTIYRKLETCGKPIAAAINGMCLGGAFELTLSCHYRLVADERSAKLGLPESKVGLLPGAGGTQRVPRLIGAQEALKLMLRGTFVEPQEALKLGLVHRVAPLDEILDLAKQWIKDGGKPTQPWDEKGFKVPGGVPYSPQGMQMWAAANALYRKETYDNYDAQRAIMACVYEGLTVKTIDAGLLIERDYFAKLLFGRQSKVMIRSLFHSMQELNKGARRPKAEPPSKVSTLGIVGAGFMGSGIAYVSASAGMNVILLDRDLHSAEKGKAHKAQLFDRDIARGRATESQKAAVLARMQAADDYAALAACDLVIEAVFENRALKDEMWRKIDAAMAPHALRASNTSTLPITGLAEYVKDQTNFIGIHFFSPVDKMQLVEIIVGKKTSSAALAKALDYVKQIKKTPIVVNDARGFFTSRVVTTHIAEGHYMLDEGVPPVLIENAGKMAGMPVGPLSLADEIALDLLLKIRQATKADLGKDYKEGPTDRILVEMVVKRERFGRKNGKGYYDYPEGQKKRLWPGIGDIVKLKPADKFSVMEIKERLLLIQALETARCFEEQVLTDVREADVGAILGFGFAPFTGGPLSYIDTMGAKTFVTKCRAYAKSHGPRYAPPQLLIDMAKSQESFYGRFAA
jgi:3-hydroxyacyl-CoA dehydrogenase/enoyl-CoA hydratase/3-hydroxybutyryl-CoA epimerase